MKRRDVFKTVGWMGASALFLKVLGTADAQVVGPGYTEQVNPYAPNDFKGLGAGSEAYTFFTGEEAKFVEAAVARLIPKDESGPGALEAGVSYYIDQQLAGAFGEGAKWYMQGPWTPGTPMQGYQLPFTPAEVYRAGISAARKYAQSKGKAFEAMSASSQDQVLKDLEAGKVSDPNVPAEVTSQFFAFLLQNTVEGFLADPAYGGNRDKTGWKQLGFPGVYLETYADFIDKVGAKLPKIVFVSLADAQNTTFQNS
ncbi:gluconate 2-dehydrogenase subunit 3 family protein [Deinococcus sp. UYEF24]